MRFCGNEETEGEQRGRSNFLIEKMCRLWYNLCYNHVCRIH